MLFPKAARYICATPWRSPPRLPSSIVASAQHRPRSITLPAGGAEHDALRIRLPAPSFGSNVTADTGIHLLQSKDPLSLEGAIRTP
jgi:hypothetical protein